MVFILLSQAHELYTRYHSFIHSLLHLTRQQPLIDLLLSFALQFHTYTPVIRPIIYSDLHRPNLDSGQYLTELDLQVEFLCEGHGALILIYIYD